MKYCTIIAPTVLDKLKYVLNTTLGLKATKPGLFYPDNNGTNN